MSPCSSWLGEVIIFVVYLRIFFTIFYYVVIIFVWFIWGCSAQYYWRGYHICGLIEDLLHNIDVAIICGLLEDFLQNIILLMWLSYFCGIFGDFLHNVIDVVIIFVVYLRIFFAIVNWCGYHIHVVYFGLFFTISFYWCGYHICVVYLGVFCTILFHCVVITFVVYLRVFLTILCHWRGYHIYVVYLRIFFAIVYWCGYHICGLLEDYLHNIILLTWLSYVVYLGFSSQYYFTDMVIIFVVYLGVFFIVIFYWCDYHICGLLEDLLHNIMFIYLFIIIILHR